MIKTQTYTTNNLLLSNDVLKAHITTFWNDIFSPIKDEKHLMIMCKVQFSEEEMGYRTLGHLRRINFNDKELFINYLSDRLGLLNDSYTSIVISNIIFSYIVKDGLATDEDRKFLQNIEDKSVTNHRFNNMNLPISMNPSDYGQVLVENVVGLVIRYIVRSNNRIYQIDVKGSTNVVRILDASELEWTDTRLNSGFKREIGKSTIYFLDGEIVLRKQLLPPKSPL